MQELVLRLVSRYFYDDRRLPLCSIAHEEPPSLTALPSACVLQTAEEGTRIVIESESNDHKILLDIKLDPAGGHHFRRAGEFIRPHRRPVLVRGMQAHGSCFPTLQTPSSHGSNKTMRPHCRFRSLLVATLSGKLCVRRMVLIRLPPPRVALYLPLN